MLIIADNSSINETQEDEYKCIFLFNLNMSLLLLGQNVCEVNRERSRLSAASSVCDSTKHNGLVTTYFRCEQDPVEILDSVEACLDKAFQKLEDLGHSKEQVLLS